MKKDKSFTGEHLLYIIATPIGNLKEFSPRAIEILNDMDYVASEDTRVSGKLLSYFDIKKKMISCHEHNEMEAGTKIISLIKEGNKVAYMSDAGYPCVSDPGSKLIKLAIENDIKVSVISGPNAMLNALVMSGLDSSKFYFHGFLLAKPSQRKEELRELRNKKETIIIYESPHRITTTLKDIYEVFGNRKAAICRELTKLHEEVIRGTLEEFLELTSEELKGEMVIVIEGNNKEDEDILSDGAVIDYVNKCISDGLSTKDAIKKASIELNINKNQIYKLFHS